MLYQKIECGLLLMGLVCQFGLSSKEVIISSNVQLERINISMGITQIRVDRIPDNTKHLILQVHSPYRPVGLSYENSEVCNVGKCINGSHTSLLTILPSFRPMSVDFYVLSTHKNLHNVWAKVSYYTIDDPIPGACNIESDLENDANVYPYPQIPLSIWLSNISFALGNQWTGEGLMDSCPNVNILNLLEYELYATPLAVAGGLVDGNPAIDTLSTNGKPVNTIIGAINTIIEKPWETATLIDKYSPRDKLPPFFTLARRLGTSQLISVVVRRQASLSSPVKRAAYVTTVMYACTGQEMDSGYDCDLVESKVLRMFVFAVVGLCGLVMATSGHLWPRIQGSVCLAFMFVLIACSITQYFIDGQYYMYLALGLVAFLGVPAIILIGICMCRCSPHDDRVSLYPSVLLLAYLVVAVLYFTPLGEMGSMKNIITFFIVFPVSHLVLLIVFLPFKKISLAVSTSTIGSFIFLCSLSLGFIPGSIFYYILIDQYLRTALPSYIEHVHYSPLGVADIMLLTMWAAFSLFLSLLIFYRLSRSSRTTGGVNSQPPTSSTSAEAATVGSVGSLDFNDPYGIDDRTSLFHGNRSNYGTVVTSTPVRSRPSYGSTADSVVPPPPSNPAFMVRASHNQLFIMPPDNHHT